MNQLQTKTQILNADAVQRKIKRMALEIAEQNTAESYLLIAGIVGNGVVVAKQLAKELKNAGLQQVEIATIHLDKTAPAAVFIEPVPDLQNKVIIIADDVANTGRTMFYALQPFFSSHPKRLQTAVLVERSHKQFPIQTDYTGLSIATTLLEHIEVIAEGEEIAGAWLY